MSTRFSPTNPIEVFPLLARGWHLFVQDAAKHVGFIVTVGLLPSFFFPGNIWSIVTIVIPIIEGSYLYALMRAFGKTPRFSDAFLIFNRALPLLLTRWATLILVSLGLAFFLLPGIYLAIAYLLAVPLVLDRPMRVWDALETSRQILTRQWFRALLLMIVIWAINAAGILLVGLGFLITAPLTTCTIVALYESLHGISGEFPYGDSKENAEAS